MQKGLSEKTTNTIIGAATLAIVILIAISQFNLKEYKPNYFCPPLPKNVQEEIKDFRPFVQDIVKTIHHHPKWLRRSDWETSGRGWTVWTANEYYGFDLQYPRNLKFREDEKRYLYNLINEKLDPSFDDANLDDL